MLKTLLYTALALPALAFAAAPGMPRIAVTDLAYEEQVSRHFSMIDYKDRRQSSNSSRSSAAGNAASNSDNSSGRSETEYLSVSGDFMQIDRGELRKFTADIKGSMLKSGVYSLVQPRPFLEKEKVSDKDLSPAEKMMPRAQRADAKLYDVIDRIKKGHFPNADYVLFCSINSIEPRHEQNPIQGSNATSVTLAMELMIECSLIATKNYEIKAAFSAMGEGQDMRLVNAVGQRVHLSSGKVMSAVSKSLGEDVASQLEAQFDPSQGRGARRDSRDCTNKSGPNCPQEVRRDEKVIEYR